MKKNFILGLAAISMLSFASCETDPAAEKNPADDVVEGIPTTATITLTNAPSTMGDRKRNPARIRFCGSHPLRI